jgi:hypothetical protein
VAALAPAAKPALAKPALQAPKTPLTQLQRKDKAIQAAIDQFNLNRPPGEAVKLDVKKVKFLSPDGTVQPLTGRGPIEITVAQKAKGLLRFFKKDIKVKYLVNVCSNGTTCILSETSQSLQRKAGRAATWILPAHVVSDALKSSKLKTVGQALLTTEGLKAGFGTLAKTAIGHAVGASVSGPMAALLGGGYLTMKLYQAHQADNRARAEVFDATVKRIKDGAPTYEDKHLKDWYSDVYVTDLNKAHPGVEPHSLEEFAREARAQGL